MGIENKEEFNDDQYEVIKKELKDFARKFWDGLFNFYDGYTIYHSSLFSREVYSNETQIRNNLFLTKENYELLKAKCYDIDISYHTKDISDLIKRSDKSYDLINLSSIIYYGNMRDYNYYKSFLSNLNLTANGIALTYLYNVTDEMKDAFSAKYFYR